MGESPALWGFLWGDPLWGALLQPPEPPKNAPPVTTAAPRFEGDALFFHTGDGGDVQVCGGEFLRSGGLRNAVYASLFWANVDDDGSPDSAGQWWGNLITDDPALQLRGQFARALRTTPLATANVARLEDVANNDLAWLVSTGVAASVDVVIAIVAPKRVGITITINSPDADPVSFAFAANWGAKS